MSCLQVQVLYVNDSGAIINAASMLSLVDAANLLVYSA